MWGFEKKIFGPLLQYVHARIFRAISGSARSIKNIFFAIFACFKSKLSYLRVTGIKNKIFIKNQLTLVDMAFHFRSEDRQQMSISARHRKRAH
jgi:hypothetical protein